MPRASGERTRVLTAMAVMALTGTAGGNDLGGDDDVDLADFALLQAACTD